MLTEADTDEIEKLLNHAYTATARGDRLALGAFLADALLRAGLISQEGAQEIHRRAHAFEQGGIDAWNQHPRTHAGASSAPAQYVTSAPARAATI